MIESVPGLLPHEMVLSGCARAGIDIAVADSPALPYNGAEIDWPGLVAQSVRHGIASPLALYLRRYRADDRLPSAIMSRLEGMFAANARRNEVIFQEAARLVRALEAAGIRCLVLKGVALALTVYPDPALRNFADVDILVDEDKFAVAEDVAQQIGLVRESLKPHSRQIHILYTARGADDIVTGTIAPEFDPTITPEMLERGRRVIKFELHRRLFLENTGLVNMADISVLWERPQTAVFPDGTPFHLPSQEAMLVHLCQHASRHDFR